jgi:lysophospholipase L1-like esterase
MLRLFGAALIILLLITSLVPVVMAAPPPDPAEYQGKIKVACVGDSITFGAGIKSRPTNCYPAQLQALLGDNYYVGNFGVSGATLLKNGNKPYWNLGAYKHALALEPDIVIIKLGTNDTKPENWKHKDSYLPDYKELVQSFASLPSSPKIYLCTPAPVIQDRWGINEKTVTEDVIPAVQQLASEMNLSVIDIYSALQGQKTLFPDGVHPNAEGAAIMAKTILKAITAEK